MVKRPGGVARGAVGMQSDSLLNWRDAQATSRVEAS